MLNIEKFEDELINMGVINPKIMIGFSKDGKLLNCRFAIVKKYLWHNSIFQRKSITKKAAEKTY